MKTQTIKTLEKSIEILEVQIAELDAKIEDVNLPSFKERGSMEEAQWSNNFNIKSDYEAQKRELEAFVYSMNRRVREYKIAQEIENEFIEASIIIDKENLYKKKAIDIMLRFLDAIEQQKGRNYHYYLFLNDTKNLNKPQLLKYMDRWIK